MPIARETVELLVQAAKACCFDDDRRGLRDLEWTALRFLARANRFSRTPSALASFIGATRATASQIVKTLEEKSYLVRKPSQTDKRSVTLDVTAAGEKLLAQHDPINSLISAVASLAPDDGIKLKVTLHEIAARVEKSHDRAETGHCRDCIFLVRGEAGGCATKARTKSELSCRLHRAPIVPQEVNLLCTSFERGRDQKSARQTASAGPYPRSADLL